MKVKDVIPNILTDLYKLSKVGGKDVNTILVYNSIYQTYNSLQDKSKMTRYQITCEITKTNINTVMNAVKFMESNFY